ncbi:iron-siderophore ABC transporter substrate-binding protein [Microbacterium sp. G2-8]|uniref:ABC transporter substrate-binding protein n=1 Tax=Microbacterium sp. G2-8 TaxID=2842454 RepID=UPI001C890389|nr:iron-siderophore ABC transporter substrate-binding protein [Microbacterium sp. G2-8]
MPVLAPRRLRPLGAVAALATGALLLTACSAPSGDDSAAAQTEGGTHAVDHARGETAVPDDPQRVVVLEPVQLDTSVALGAIPVGTAVLSEETGVPAYLGDEAADIEMVGTVTEPSVERIAALEPDLILGTESRHSALYDQLSDVAPTVFMDTQADPWQDNVALVAEALGDEQGAEDLLADYEARCTEIADEYDTAGQTAQLVRPRDTRLTLYGPLSFAGSTLECAGFTTPEHDWEDISLDISPEQAREAEADLVLVTTADVDDPTTMPASIADNADAFGDLELVDFSFWITGVGPVGGMTVLDDLERILQEG